VSTYSVHYKLILGRYRRTENNDRCVASYKAKCGSSSCVPMR